MPERFASVDAALAWAYQVVATDIVKISSLGRMRGAERPRVEASPQEIHGQAAQIIAHVERLPDLSQAYVHARYWPSRRDRSGALDDSYQAAMAILVQSVLSTQGTGVHSQRAARVAVLQYFEGAGSRNFQGVHWVQRELRCRKSTALDMRRAVWDRLDAIQRDAWVRLEESLSEAGLLDGSPAD